MKPLKCIIIDDEPDAVDAIENILLNDCENIQVLAKCNDPKLAAEQIRQLNPDFIFLDIEMPGMNGFELLESVEDCQFKVIFSTAYDEYAVQAIKNNALDYILKPVSIEEVQSAIEKLREHEERSVGNIETYKQLFHHLNDQASQRVKIITSNGFEILYANEIVRIEASGSYSIIFLKSGEQIVISRSVKELEELLISYGFFRTHRSHLINLSQVKRYVTENEGEIIMCDQSQVPLSRRRRNDFMTALDAIL